ncbi:hypothetical protein D3C81_1977960 [compost metagenome]
MNTGLDTGNLYGLSGKSQTLCRSELARDERKDDASIQKDRVIVDALREQARSYRSADCQAVMFDQLP